LIDVPTEMVDASIRAFVECGRHRHECVVFWTGPVGELKVDEVIHPHHDSSKGSYDVDNRWLNELWFALGRRRRMIHAQVHTHPGAAFHSTRDDRGAVAAHDGFLSIVVPDFGKRGALLGARAYEITARGWRCVSSLDAVIRVI
jgi:hypothetical protein